MNAATVIQLSASQPVAYGKNASRAAVSDPLHIRFGAFELNESDARL